MSPQPTQPRGRSHTDSPSGPGASGPVAEELLAALDPEQRQVAEHFDGPLVVLAGAGTGKTRAMTHRIAYGVHTRQFRPTEVLALTFTSKAAGEMRSRLRSLGVPSVQARTFHSAALRQLRFFWSSIAEGPFPDLLTHKAGVLSQTMAGLGFEPEREVVRDVAAEIEYAAASLLGVEEYLHAAGDRELPDGIDVASMERIMLAYSEMKSRRRLIDFEDVLLVLNGVLGTREDIAAKVHSQYSSFVVDEFQDVSPLQYDLLRRWLGRRESLCVVGDPAQTIYTFAGATDSFLLGLRRDLPNASTVRLVRNYRSSADIVDTANRLLAHTGRGALVLQATHPRMGPVQYFEYGDDPSEAAAVADAIAHELAAGRAAQDIAVLFRTNGQSQAYEEALAARGITYVLRGGERFFARPEVKQALVMLNAATRTHGVGPLPEVVREVLENTGWSAAGESRVGAAREKWESLAAIVDLAEAMQADSEIPVPLETFVAELADRQEHQFAPPINGVTLASVHAAKGLEWDSVHVVGLSEGLMPISYASEPAEIAEERRLLYVAVTRARKQLRLSWSKARHAGRAGSRRPSRFLAELRGDQPRQVPQARRSRAAGTTRGGDTVHCQKCQKVLVNIVERRIGRCGDCPGAIDPQLLEALKDWRKQAAEDHQIPAYMVLTNATLNMVAEVAPRNREELARVPGIGPVKQEQFGEAIIETVRQQRSDNAS